MTDKPARSPLFASEDWISVWLGFILLAMVVAGWRIDLPKFGWSTGEFASLLAGPNLASVFMIGALFLGLSIIGVKLVGGQPAMYAFGFPFIFILGWLAQALAGNAVLKQWGLSYVIVALFIGLLISNVVGIPPWLREAVRTEYYIKAGLVILGSNIIFGEILQAGVLGVAQAFLVILVVWYVCFWICGKLGVDDEFAAMLSTAVSICGVSAAIAACGAIQGDRKKLSYVTSLVLIVAAPMMIVMPWLIERFDIPPMVGGAWVGGTIDTSGAVVAAGELIGESAMNAAVIVKFSQNAMLGLAAFGLSLWWTMRKGSSGGEKPSAAIIWERFPKFVLGFMLASLVFSFVLNADMVAETKGLVKGLRTWWFALAFVCVGLETRFKELLSMGEGRPAMAFLAAQGVNVVWTLLIAYLLFGGILFPAPDL